MLCHAPMLRSQASEGPEVILANYLHKRRNSQNWQLRWMVPLAARPVIGKSEFTRSLGTPDRRQAASLGRAILVEWERQVAAALDRAAPDDVNRPIEPDMHDIEDVALRIVHDGFSAKLPALIRRCAREGRLAALREKFQTRQAKALQEFHAGDRTFWAAKARQAIAKRDWRVGEADFDKMVSLLERGGLDAYKLALSQIDGNERALTTSPSVQEALHRRAAAANNGEEILSLYDRYAVQRIAEGRKRKDTLDQDRKIVELFSEFVGRARRLDSVGESEVREWRNIVASLPPAFKKRRENRNLTLRQAGERAKALNLPSLSLTTVNKYLSAVSALFSWACEEGYASKNPCENLYHDLRKGRNRQRKRRPPFDSEKLNAILATPLFTGFHRDGKEWEPGNCRADDWRFWIPLACLFTGARIGEIAQLRLDDVKSQSGLPYLLLKEDEEKNQKTKSGANRPAPIHSKLVEIGFLRFVERQRSRAASDGDDRLFPELVANKRGQIGWTPSRFWRTYLTRIGVKNGSDGYGAHSFRHGLADQLRLAGFLDSEVAIVLGHSQSSVTANYGIIQQGTLDRLHSMIEAVKFEGVSFDGILRS